MNNAKPTIRLPEAEIAFIKKYAKKHNLSISNLIHRNINLIKFINI
ncbi:MAG: DUF6364 family protein [bacterium]